MSLKEFIFEFEELELDLLIIRYTLDASYEWMMDQMGEEAECVIAGISRNIFDLSRRMEELKDRGLEALGRS